MACGARSGLKNQRLRRISYFFFQAEDGIRDLTVTGVQTCALPIFGDHGLNGLWSPFGIETRERSKQQIGRASCRERVEICVGLESLKMKIHGLDPCLAK